MRCGSTTCTCAPGFQGLGIGEWVMRWAKAQARAQQRDIKLDGAGAQRCQPLLPAARLRARGRGGRRPALPLAPRRGGRVLNTAQALQRDRRDRRHGPAPCHRQGHHAARIHPRRPSRAGRRAAHRAAAAHRQLVPARDLGRAGRGQVDLHRDPGPAADRARATASRVLTIDPSSTVSGGSILGDKTRMERLWCTSAPTSGSEPLRAARSAAWPMEDARGDAGAGRPRLRTR